MEGYMREIASERLLRKTEDGENALPNRGLVTRGWKQHLVVGD
jgi:hypothetical protein